MAGATPAAAALRRIGRQPLSWLACVAVTAVLLALLLAGGVLAWNLRAALEQPAFAAEATVFLATTATPAEAAGLRAPLLALPAVHSLGFVDRDAAFAQLARDLGDPAAAGAVADLEAVPLPNAWVLGFAPGADPGLVEASLAAARKLPGVDSVVADLRWYRNWLRLLQAGSLAGAGIAALALFATAAWTLLAASAWFRLDADEVRLLDILGADDAWILGPRVRLGALTGLAAGVAAPGLDWLLLHWLLPVATAAFDAGGLPFPALTLPPAWAAAPLAALVSILAALATAVLARGQLRRVRRSRPAESWV